jgi:hypothetical protein
MEYECACFHLNTTDIDTQNTGNVNNSYGSVNQFRNDITWYNINFKTILGDIYNKYDKFNIRLCSIMYSSVLAPSANAVDLSLKINVGGLPFSNCTYHTISNSNTSRCIMGGFQLNTNSEQLYFGDDNLFTIEKPPETTNVRIYLSRLSDVPPSWNSLGPQFDFYFRIYGIKNS